MRPMSFILAAGLALAPGLASAQTWRSVNSAESGSSYGFAFNSTGICHRDDDLNLHAVYRRNNTLVHAVKTSTTWDTTDAIPSYAAGAVSAPTLAWLPGTDSAIVGWIEHSGGTDYVVTRTTDDAGATWSSSACEVRASTDPLAQLTLGYGYGGDGSDPTAAACWQYDGTTVQCTMWGTDHCPGGFYSNVSDGDGENPSVDLRAGVTHVAWDANIQGSQKVRYRSHSGSTWSAITDLANGGDPSIAVRASGGMIYVGYHRSGSVYALSSSDGGSTWAAPTSTGAGGYLGAGLFARATTAYAPSDVAIAWEETSSGAKLPGLAYVDDDFASMTPVGMPTFAISPETVLNTVCMNNGYLDYLWLYTDTSTGTQYVLHRAATL